MRNLITGALYFEDLREISKAAIEFLDSTMSILNEDLDDRRLDRKRFHRLHVQSRAEWAAQTRIAAHLVEQVESRLKYFGLSRGFRDSESVWLLTLLASIFLPMSLASGILSMSTRLKELHFLLYNFVSLVVLLGSFGVTLFIALKSLVLLLDLWTKSIARPGRLARTLDGPEISVAAVCAFALVLGAWAIIFTSFMVGMIKDVGLGLKILGFGFAAYSGVIIMIQYEYGWLNLCFDN